MLQYKKHETCPLSRKETAIPRRAAVIVAHPDDETLWAGGTILSRPGWQWFVVSLSRAHDQDRAPKFFRALECLHARGTMGDMDDGPDQAPLHSPHVRHLILSLLPTEKYDLVLTHGMKGEYTRHRRHEETSRAVRELCDSGTINANALCTFAYGEKKKAAEMRELMHLFEIREGSRHRHVHAALALRKKPYYALCSYKVYRSERFDLLGNSLAILFGLTSPTRARNLISWIETECETLKKEKELALDLPPCLFPYIRQQDPDWRARYERFNLPGEYHNGGVWPFVCGFYVAALVAAGRQRLAEKKLLDLTRLIHRARGDGIAFGFNEWFKAQDGRPMGQDWQTWSAAMYLYAAAAVERGKTPFFPGTGTSG